jgi:WD40 repeat protein
MRVWRASERAVLALALAPDGALAAAGEGDPAVRVWDAATGAERWRFSLFRESAVCLAFAPDGRTLAAGRPWSVELWDTATGGQRLILEGHRHFSASLAFAADGGALLSAGTRLGGRYPGSPQAIVWDLADGRVSAEFVGPATTQPGLTQALDVHTVLWVRPDGSLKGEVTATVSDVPTGRARAVLDAAGPVRAAALAPDRRVLAAAVRGDVHLWAAAEVLEDPPAAESPTAWEAVRQWLSRPGRLSAALPLAPRLSLPGAAERIDAVAFTPDGQRLLAGSAVGTIRAWDVPDLPAATDEARVDVRPALVFDWGIGPVTALAVAPDGLTAAAGSSTGSVVVWDLDV